MAPGTVSLVLSVCTDEPAAYGAKEKRAGKYAPRSLQPDAIGAGTFAQGSVPRFLEPAVLRATLKHAWDRWGFSLRLLLGRGTDPAFTPCVTVKRCFHEKRNSLLGAPGDQLNAKIILPSALTANEEPPLRCVGRRSITGCQSESVSASERAASLDIPWTRKRKGSEREHDGLSDRYNTSWMTFSSFLQDADIAPLLHELWTSLPHRQF
jgi:hypothetical protein